MHLEKVLAIKPLLVEIAPSFCICRTPYYTLCDNSSATTHEPNKLIRVVQCLVQDFIKSDSTTLSYASTLALSYTLIPTLALVLAPISTKELFKQCIKTYKAFVKVLE